MADDSDGKSARSGIIPSQLYEMRLPKGKIGKLQIKIWDKVRSCDGESCELYDDCPYFRTDEQKFRATQTNKLGACKVEQRYLYSILSPFLDLLQKVPDPFVMQWVGMHIVPMYHDLVQLKMEKAKLRNVVYYDSKGVKRVHPIYDQLLRTHKEILGAWKTTGLAKIASDAGFFHAGGVMAPSPDDDILNGDPDSYDEMSEGA
jgi:hypothetical protein